MTIFLTFLAFIFVTVAYAVSLDDRSSEWDNRCGSYLFIIGMITLVYICYEAQCKPQAIDVWRGKTILKVTYENDVPVDSVVVFK